MSRIHVVLFTFFALFTSGGARGLSQGSTSGFEVTESSHLYSTTEQPQYAEILGIYPEKPLERREGTAVHLQCLVQYKSELAHCHVEVSWERTRGPETEMERLSTNGVLHAPWRRNSNFKAEVSKQVSCNHNIDEMFTYVIQLPVSRMEWCKSIAFSLQTSTLLGILDDIFA